MAEIISQESASDRPGSIFPIWNPDGGRITTNILSDTGDLTELVIFNIGGANIRQTTSMIGTKAGQYIPRAWSSEGQWLAARYPNLQGDIYILRQDGREIYQVSTKGAVTIIGWVDDENFYLN